jgi:hypothetical protein
MNPRKKILILLAGVVTALLLVIYTFSESDLYTSLLDIKKPGIQTPASTIIK